VSVRVSSLTGISHGVFSGSLRGTFSVYSSVLTQASGLLNEFIYVF
jgi:hypothetical protein